MQRTAVGKRDRGRREPIVLGPNGGTVEIARIYSN
jgi:hypothetical protein